MQAWGPKKKDGVAEEKSNVEVQRDVIVVRRVFHTLR